MDLFSCFQRCKRKDSSGTNPSEQRKQRSLKTVLSELKCRLSHKALKHDDTLDLKNSQSAEEPRAEERPDNRSDGETINVHAPEIGAIKVDIDHIISTEVPDLPIKNSLEPKEFENIESQNLLNIATNLDCCLLDNVCYDLSNTFDCQVNYGRLTEFLQFDEDFVDYTLYASPIFDDEDQSSSLQSIESNGSLEKPSLGAPVCNNPFQNQLDLCLHKNALQNRQVGSVVAAVTTSKFEPDKLGPISYSSAVKPPKHRNPIFNNENVRPPSVESTKAATSYLKLKPVAPQIQSTSIQHAPTPQQVHKPNATTITDNSEFIRIVSLHKVPKQGYIINTAVHLGQRHWNCLTGTNSALYCELCRGPLSVNRVQHCAVERHAEKLKECLPLKEFGLSMVKLVNCNRYHCGVCNKTFKLKCMRIHVASEDHIAMLRAATLSARQLMANDSSKLTVLYAERGVQRPNPKKRQRSRRCAQQGSQQLS